MDFPLLVGKRGTNTTPVNSRLRLGYVNPWSVRNKALEIADFIFEENLDLLALVETWLTGGVEDKVIEQDLIPNDYSMVQLPRTTGRGGGVALIFRNSLKIRRDTKPCAYETFECLKCSVHGTETAQICIIYRSPSNTSCRNFLDEFSDFLSNIACSLGHLILLGDFNFHVNKAEDLTAKRFIETVHGFGLVQLITEPTHRSGNTLDLIIVRESDNIVSSVHVKDCGFPDHHAIMMELQLERPKSGNRTVTYRKLKDLNHDALRECIQSSTLMSPATATLPIDDLVHAFNQELTTALNSVAPLKTKTISSRPESFWFTEDVREAKQSRRAAERKWRKSGLQIHRDIFICKKAQVNNLVAKAKTEYYRVQIEESKGNPKRLYQVVNRLTGRQKSKLLPESHCDEVLANKFATYFTEKIVLIQESIPSVSPESNSTQYPEVSQPLTEFAATSRNELKELIMKSNDKFCSVDPLPTTLLKEMLDELLPVIEMLINRSLREGHFPAPFKSAIVNPLLKKQNANQDELSNYRPVSNVAFISKVLEKVVAIQLRDHLKRNELDEPLQSAYRPQHSCETALIKVHNDIIRSLDERKVVILVLLDMSAAFDTMNHRSLLRVLECTGVSGIALQWFSSYLSNRTQSMLIRSSISDPHELKCGVPQGSVLGPLLFTIYTAGLGAIIRQHLVGYHFYADDSQIYVSTGPEKLEEAISALEACLRDVRTWLCGHGLKLNESKTELLVISSKHNAQQGQTVTIGESSIAQTHKARNLGVMMDVRATMEDHVNVMCRAAYAQLRAIKRLQPYLDQQSLETVVHAFVSSRLDFCNSLLAGINQRLLDKLQRVQNAAARIVSRTPKCDHITPVLKSLHWLPVTMRIQYKILVTVYKCLNDLAPKYLQNLLKVVVNPRALRSSHVLNLEIPRTNLNCANQAFSVIGPKLWNSLPNDIRMCKNLNTFKSLLKTHLFKKYFIH